MTSICSTRQKGGIRTYSHSALMSGDQVTEASGNKVPASPCLLPLAAPHPLLADDVAMNSDRQSRVEAAMITALVCCLT